MIPNHPSIILYIEVAERMMKNRDFLLIGRLGSLYNDNMLCTHFELNNIHVTTVNL